MTHDEELDLKHQIESLETDLTRINAESSQSTKDFASMKAIVADLQHIVKSLHETLILLPTWLNHDHLTPESRVAFDSFSKLLKEIETRLGQSPQNSDQSKP